jgi:hypothetical protein
MTQPQQIAIWPASIREVVERKETPYRLLDKKAGALARCAWWLLGKLKALDPYYESVRSWTYVPHEQAALHEAMLKAVDYDLRYIYEGKAVFIVGGATFSELVGAPAFRDQMRFVTGPFSLDDGYRGRRMFDIPIHVVPNMTGFAVVPRVVIETKK